MLKIKIPTKWQDLSQKQLEYLLKMKASGLTDATIQTAAFLYFAELNIYKTEKDAVLMRRGLRLYRVKPTDITIAAMQLDFITDPPAFPQLLQEYRGKKAIDQELHGLPFGHYLRLENLLQQYLREQHENLIQQAAAILYPEIKEVDCDAVLTYAILHWYNGIKTYFAGMFPDLFRRLKTTEQDEQPDLREAMLAQIRALTGGDVTKEADVLNVDTWTALAELDAKAREAKEFAKK